MRRLISSGSPFESQVGYSRAVVQGDWCFVSGCTGTDPVSQTMPSSATEQARNALALIGRVLEEAGFELADVVRAHYYFSDVAYWNEVAPVLGETFGTVRPAATALICGLVTPEMKVEIEVTAFRG